METTKELFERAKLAAGCKNDYQFFKRYGLHSATVSRWSSGKSTFDDESAELIAEILKIDPGYVMACAHAERSKSEESRKNWERIASMVSYATLGPGAEGWRRGCLSALAVFLRPASL